MAALSHPIQGQACGVWHDNSVVSTLQGFYASQTTIYIQPNTPPHQRRGEGGRLLIKAFLLLTFKKIKINKW